MAPTEDQRDELRAAINAGRGWRIECDDHMLMSPRMASPRPLLCGRLFLEADEADEDTDAAGDGDWVDTGFHLASDPNGANSVADVLRGFAGWLDGPDDADVDEVAEVPA